MPPSPDRFRQIHLDFHTGPAIPGVGSVFDPERFADTLAAAHVDSVTMFAKCHHGHLYYETDHPAKHPTLSCDLLPRQIEALRARDIRCPIYLSVQCDEFAADTHPEWIALNPDGSRVGRKPLENGYFSWQILDMASPYLDYLCQQTIDVMKKFGPVDGLFFDMCWDQPSASNWAKAKMKTWGLDPDNAEERKVYARRLSHEYMERISNLAEEYQKDVPIWFNSRPLIRLREEKKFLRHVEIEALPTGAWGYTYFPVHARLSRPLEMPLIGMTGRFHVSWADFGGLRTAPSLLYDCAQALAHGAACSIGDQLHPAGVLDQGVYDVIGSVYSHVEKCEPWSRDVRAVKEIAVLFEEPTDENQSARAHEGAYRALAPLGYQFVYLPPEEKFEDYQVVIVPDSVSLTDELESRLAAYEKSGGKVIQEVTSGEKSPFSVTYCRFEPEAASELPSTDHVFYERGVRLSPLPGDKVLAQVVEPYFERSWERFCSHAQTPGLLETSGYAAALIRGNRALLAFPVLRAYAVHGNLACRQLVASCLSQLLPEPTIKVSGPRYLEALVNQGEGFTAVHLLSFIPQKRTPQMEMVEEAVPSCDIVLSIKADAPIKGVSLQPQGQTLSFKETNGRVEIAVDRVDGHGIVVVEDA